MQNDEWPFSRLTREILSKARVFRKGPLDPSHSPLASHDLSFENKSLILTKSKLHTPSREPRALPKNQFQTQAFEFPSAFNDKRAVTPKRTQKRPSTSNTTGGKNLNRTRKPSVNCGLLGNIAPNTEENGLFIFL